MNLFTGPTAIAVSLGYVGLLFFIAWRGDRDGKWFRSGRPRAVVYALSLAVYCTSWTYYGSVGLASHRGLDFVPIVVRDSATDPYAAVAENQKRHGLSPLELARFIKGRVVAGESNAVIARKLGMDLTTVAHHLALLDLPPPVDQALKTGLCTSPRTLYELSKLHDEKPEQVSALIAGGDITRSAVAALKAPRSLAPPTLSPRPTELAKATATCALLERSLDKINRARGDFREADLTDFRQRLSELAHRLG